METETLRLDHQGEDWSLSGLGADRFKLVGAYLSYLTDRAYSPRTVEAYAFDLLSFCRWLVTEELSLQEVTTEGLLGYLNFCRNAPVRGREGGNVYSIRDGRNTGLAASSINRRLVAISGFYNWCQMLDPEATNPAPKGSGVRRMASGERTGMLGHLAKPQPHSKLRLRQPRRLPRNLDSAEAKALLGSFKTHRDKAIAGLMLFCGLRSAEVLTLAVSDIDMGKGWIRVRGKGAKERRVPLDIDVGALIQAYLLAERPETTSKVLFLVAKGPHRGQPLTRAGLRTVFRYHREKTGVIAGHPHALRHSFGSALAEAGVDLAVISELMGHDHVSSSVAYIHLAPSHVRASYDAARAHQRAIKA